MTNHTAHANENATENGNHGHFYMWIMKIKKYCRIIRVGQSILVLL